MAAYKVEAQIGDAIVKGASSGVCVHSFFLYKNVVFPTQAEYSYFSADFRLKIFLYYS